MKKIIRFSRFFVPGVIISSVLAVAGIAGYFFFGGKNGGFNLGIDFQAGLIQEVQLAPTAFSLTWSGKGDASISFDRNNLYIVVSGAGVEGRTHQFSFNEYPTAAVMTQALGSQIEGLSVNLNAPPATASRYLVFNTQGNPRLGETPYVVHYLEPQSSVITIADVRDALISLGQTVSVQSVGQPSDRHFMIRLEDKEIEKGESTPAEMITNSLEGYFGRGEVVVLRSDYVGSRFSKNLTDQAGILLALTLLIILIYCSIRFKPQYAFAAVLAIIHDGIMMIAFVVWSRMEFNTTTIAAIMTILGYSLNDTIVIFDRMRETRRIYPDDTYLDVLDRSLTETLSRTIITTLTTILAVVVLFIFTTGSMRDFALVLLVGMISGVYSTIFIASGFVYLWEQQKNKRAKRKLASSAHAGAANVPASAKA